MARQRQEPTVTLWIRVTKTEHRRLKKEAEFLKYRSMAAYLKESVDRRKQVALPEDDGRIEGGGVPLLEPRDMQRL